MVAYLDHSMQVTQYIKDSQFEVLVLFLFGACFDTCVPWIDEESIIRLAKVARTALAFARDNDERAICDVLESTQHDEVNTVPPLCQ